MRLIIKGFWHFEYHMNIYLQFVLYQRVQYQHQRFNNVNTMIYDIVEWKREPTMYISIIDALSEICYI